MEQLSSSPRITHPHHSFRLSLFVIIVILAFISPIYSEQGIQKPGSNNTGPTLSREAMKPVDGSQNIAKDGTTLENLFIRGLIRIKANDVTIRNCYIYCTSQYGIQATFKDSENVFFKGLVIENCTIWGMDSAAVYGRNFELRNSQIHDSKADAVKAVSNYVIEGNWIYGLGLSPTSHADGIQVTGGSNGIIRHNNFDLPHNAEGYKNSQCLMISTNNGPVSNIVIEENWINGGNFAIQIRDKKQGHGPPSDIIIQNNIFGRGQRHGTWVIDGKATIIGNIWEDNGKLLPNQQRGKHSSFAAPID